MRRSWLGLTAIALLHACSRPEPPADGAGAAESVDPRSSAVFGQAPQAAAPEEARRIATRAVQTVSSQCGGGCTADLEAGRAHLAAGRMQDAFAALKCADTPAAAFGAGIAKLFGAIESPAADQLLADIAEEPFPATDVFGPSGYLARVDARWNGGAELNVEGALSLAFTTERAMADDWELDVHHNDGARRISLYVETDESQPVGTPLVVRYDCANFARAIGAMPRVQLSVREGEGRIDCDVRSAANGCDPDGGTMLVIAHGVQPGARVEYRFMGLQLACNRSTEDAAPIAVQPPAAFIRLTGSAFATVTANVDTSDLHAAFDGDKEDAFIDRIDASLPAETFMGHAAAVAGEVAGSRCYFDKAAAGTGTVFTAPGAMYGGQDLALDAGDARMFAAAASAGAAFVELATAYEVDLPLRTLACWTHDDLGEHRLCPTHSAFMQSANAAWKGARIRHDRIEAAKQLVALALADFEAGAPKLGPESAFARNAISVPGWTVLQELVHAARRSLTDGRTAVPHVTPAVQVDLRGFFAAPPDPSQIMHPLLSLRGDTCEDPECEPELSVEALYFNAFFDDTDADFVDGDYEFAREQRDAFEDGVREVLLQLDSVLFTVN